MKPGQHVKITEGFFAAKIKRGAKTGLMWIAPRMRSSWIVHAVHGGCADLVNGELGLLNVPMSVIDASG